jgi:signal transduction histidine kinase
MLDVAYWITAGSILHFILDSRIKAEATTKMTTPTSEELFNLFSLNKWNPLNSPEGVIALLVSICISVIPHSVLTCFINNEVISSSSSPLHFGATVLIQSLTQITGSIVSTAVVFSVHQSWCDFLGIHIITTSHGGEFEAIHIPPPPPHAQIVDSTPCTSAHTTATTNSSSQQSKNQTASLLHHVGPENDYHGLEVLVCFSAICCMFYIPTEFMHKVSLSPNVFLPFLSFLVVLWPIFRFGNSGTSVALLVTLIINSTNIAANGFSYYSVAKHQSLDNAIIVLPYPVYWMMCIFQVFSISLSVCSLLMSSSARQLVELENSLQQVVRMRTHQLQQTTDQLRSQMDEAVRSSNIKSQFLSTMSHEIRTPMNGLVGMAELLDLTALSCEQEEIVSNIRSSSQHLVTIVNDILDFSKLEDGKMTLRLTCVQIKSIVDRAIALSYHKENDHLQLTYEEGDGVPSWIMIDAVRLKQVIVNLLTNAFKFTEIGGVHIKVCIVPISAEDEASYRKYHATMPDRIKRSTSSQDGEPLINMKIVKLMFTVADTGIGIPRDQIHRLFESFGQLDSSSTRQYGGTGLGLVICNRIVELMSGKIWVDNEPSKGACFYFTIVTFVPTDDGQQQQPPPKPLQSMVLTTNDNTHFTQKYANIDAIGKIIQYDHKLAHCLYASYVTHSSNPNPNTNPNTSTKPLNIMIAHSSEIILRSFNELSQQVNKERVMFC